MAVRGGLWRIDGRGRECYFRRQSRNYILWSNAMKNGTHVNGHHGVNGSKDVRLNIPDRTEETMYGVSQIGIHDLVPQMGYREYWYPAIEVKKLGRKPRRVKMLGDDIVLFRGKDGKVGALKDRCPHRGAFLSYGKCEFEGTISCPYHGYTYDETGKCVAAITEGPDSPMVGKLKARAYPTAVLGGVAYVWMGQTDPVPLQEDLPSEFFDPDYAVHVYSKMWPMNWAVSIEQNEDAHFSWIHRFRMRRLFTLEAFRQIPAYWSGMSVVGETDGTMGIKPTVKAPQQAYYPGLGKKWPQRVWWRFLKFPVPGINVKSFTGKPYRSEHYLPSITRGRPAQPNAEPLGGSHRREPHHDVHLRHLEGWQPVEPHLRQALLEHYLALLADKGRERAGRPAGTALHAHGPEGATEAGTERPRHHPLAS